MTEEIAEIMNLQWETSVSNFKIDDWRTYKLFSIHLHSDWSHYIFTMQNVSFMLFCSSQCAFKKNFHYFRMSLLMTVSFLYCLHHLHHHSWLNRIKYNCLYNNDDNYCKHRALDQIYFLEHSVATSKFILKHSVRTAFQHLIFTNHDLFWQSIFILLSSCFEMFNHHFCQLWDHFLQFFLNTDACRSLTEIIVNTAHYVLILSVFSC